MKRVLMSLVLLGLAGCSSMPFMAPPVPQDPATAATVVVYRKSAFYGSLADENIGEKGKVYATLGNGQYVVFRLTPGLHVIVASPTTPSLYKNMALPVELKPASKTCIDATMDASGFYKMFIPFYYLLNPIYSLQVTECPADSEMAKLAAATLVVSGS